VLTEDLGIKLENVKVEDLGRAKRITVDKENTTIVEGAGKTSEIQVASASSSARSRRRPPTTTAKSSRSGSRSWPAAWP